MLGREARVQATFGRPGCYDNALWLGFVRAWGRSQLSREAAAESIEFSLRKIAGAAGGTPILTLNMYEHSYHIEYRAKAAKYVDVFMAAINWPAVQRANDELQT